jgi:hypothetical protein
MLLASCTTVHRVPRPASVAELQTMTERDVGPGAATRAGREAVTLLVQDAETSRVVSVPGPVALSAAGDGASPAVDLSRVGGYDVKRPGRGGLEGLAIGLLLGAVGGGLIGAAAGDWDDCDLECGGIPGETATILGAVFFGGVFAIIGLFTGAAVGHTDRYVFE